jgi:hypothetical protein
MLLIKELPIKQPILASYPFHAHLHTILSSVEESLPWIYSNYIQLVTYDIYNTSRPWFDYYILDMPNSFNYCPWLKRDSIIYNDSLFLFGKNISEFTIELIRSDYYVIIGLDDFYIHSHPSYNKKHFLHEYLFSGYDLNNSTFIFSGNLENYKYTSSKMNFSTLEQAFNGNNRGVLDEPAIIRIRLIKIDKKDNDFVFQLPIVINLLEDYLLSKDTSERYKYLETSNLFKGKYYGLQTYGCLIEYLQSLRKDDYLDIRPFYIIWEHKKLMLKRIQFLYSQKYLHGTNEIYDQYCNVVKSSNILLNLALKYNISKKFEIILKLVTLIKSLITSEVDILNTLLEKISDNKALL